MERTPVVEVDGSLVHIQNVRNNVYRSVDDFDVVWEDRTYDLDRLAPIFEKATGISMTEEQMNRIGEKISHLTRLYNLANGRTRRDDTLPQRFFQEEHQAGIFEGQRMTEEVFGQWLEMYYTTRGWDSSGVPTDAKLQEFGLQRL